MHKTIYSKHFWEATSKICERTTVNQALQIEMVSRSQIMTTLDVLAASFLQQKHVLLWQALDQKKEVECLVTIATTREPTIKLGILVFISWPEVRQLSVTLEKDKVKFEIA